MPSEMLLEDGIWQVGSLRKRSLKSAMGKIDPVKGTLPSDQAITGRLTKSPTSETVAGGHHARAAKFDVEPAFRRGIRSRRDERKTVPGRTKRGAAEQLETPRPSRGLLQTVL